MDWMADWEKLVLLVLDLGLELVQGQMELSVESAQQVQVLGRLDAQAQSRQRPEPSKEAEWSLTAH
jgi:hypothetical protein